MRGLLALVICAIAIGCQSAAVMPTEPQSAAGQSIQPTTASSADGDQGIYGTIAGGGGAPPGVGVAARGECIAVLDASSGATVANGTCDESGGFRIALAPGSYIVVAAGQRRTVQVQAGQWVNRGFRLHVP